MGKGRSYEKRDHFYREYYRAMRYRERLRRLEELGNVPRPIRYPEGPRLRSTLISHAHGLRILVPEEELTSHFSNERCWVKLGIKGKTLIRQYDPNSTREFYVSKGIGEIGEEVEVTINKLSLAEFVTMAIKGGRSPFSVEIGQPGNYHLVIGNERISMTLAMDLHFERGSLKRPAVIFAVKDYRDEKHGIKIAHDGYSEPFIGFKARNWVGD